MAHRRGQLARASLQALAVRRDTASVCDASLCLRGHGRKFSNLAYAVVRAMAFHRGALQCGTATRNCDAGLRHGARHAYSSRACLQSSRLHDLAQVVKALGADVSQRKRPLALESGLPAARSAPSLANSALAAEGAPLASPRARPRRLLALADATLENPLTPMAWPGLNALHLLLGAFGFS